MRRTLAASLLLLPLLALAAPADAAPTCGGKKATMVLGPGDDVVVLGAGDDYFYDGRDGPNRLLDGNGEDTVDGRGGDDFCTGEVLVNC